MNTMIKLRSKIAKKKGFTLVEVIIVLVILAILAAIFIPTLTGYIDKANQKTVIAECRSVVMAAQTLASEKYAQKDKLATADITAANGVFELAEITSTSSFADITVSAKGKVTKVTYTDGSYTVTYTNTTKYADPVAGASITENKVTAA